MSRHGQIQRAQPASEAQAARTAQRPPAGPTRRARAALSVATASVGMATRAVSLPAREVVFVKGLVEASDGLASIFAERGGELVIAAPLGREAELDELLADLQIELGARVDGSDRWDKHRQEQ